MKNKDLIKILSEDPENNISLSVSDQNNHFFCDRIIEVTKQGNVTTIVADITEKL